MRIAPDGSPVDLYRRLPARQSEAELLHDLLPAGGAVLDLGCGAGRLAEPLAALGHPVTGVDNEPAMLAVLNRATGVCAEITTLDMPDRFDAVLAMSHLVNTADDEFVAAVLTTARRHVTGAGFVVVERHAPGWVHSCTDSDHERDGVRYRLTIHSRDQGQLTATIRYEFDGNAAEQRFSARDVPDDRLADLAAAAGLRAVGALNPAETLVRLEPAQAPSRAARMVR